MGKSGGISPVLSGVSAINSLVAFYDIHVSKREVLFFNSVPDTTSECVTIGYITRSYPP
jgi:hypothetical protein